MPVKLICSRRLGYINELFKRCLLKDYDVGNIINAATINAVKLYSLNIGLLRVGDAADFVEVDNMKDFNILSTFINGEEVMRYNNPQFGGGNVNYNLEYWESKSGEPLKSGYISLQSESHPVEFKNIEILEL